MQINKYANTSEYSADKNRKTTESAVSYIQSEKKTKFDGVNVITDGKAAEIGDIVVFDENDKQLKYVKFGTINKANLPQNYKPCAVVYEVRGDENWIVSLNGTDNRWAQTYSVAVKGFNLSGGGTFVLNINSKPYTFEYGAGSTLGTIKGLIDGNAEIKEYGWRTEIDEIGNRIIMSINTWSSAYSKISATSGCTLDTTAENINYQTTASPLGTDYVRRKNYYDSYFAGANPEKFYEYYSVNGKDELNIELGSGTILKESAFTAEKNPAVFNAYKSYKEYLLEEHMLMYPSVYGAVSRNGKENTAKIGSLDFVDVKGQTVPCYPAANYCLNFSVNEKLAKGQWWLPSVEEIYLLIKDRAKTTSLITEEDRVNTSLQAIGASMITAGGAYLWTSCEYSSTSAFYYGRDGGGGYNGYKFGSFTCRAVSALKRV